MTESAAWRVAWRAVLLVLALLLLIYVVTQLRSVLVQLSLAILFAAAASPLVDALTTPTPGRRTRWRMPRPLAALLVFAAALLSLVVMMTIVVATVGPDLRALGASAPTYIARGEQLVAELLAANPELAARVNEALPSVQSALGGAFALLAQAPRLIGVATG
ncbi:MAG: AI-2E family transporter, partial [Chloroflexota bacterium]|nr:AI-2E family transporter [Chloroflexota bacterium]